MKTWMRLLVAVLLVAFASGTVVQVAQASAMDVKMALAVDGDSDGGCSGCPFGGLDSSAACTTGCVLHVFGVPNESAGTVTGPVNQAPRPAFLRSVVDWQAPPDPYPPRTIVLS